MRFGEGDGHETFWMTSSPSDRPWTGRSCQESLQRLRLFLAVGVVESRRDQQAGHCQFHYGSSYLRGPGFAAMREHMRKAFDEIWIIDLEGDNLGAAQAENVFNIQSPVAIAIGVRYAETKVHELAKVHYARMEGTRAEKLGKPGQSKNSATWNGGSACRAAPTLSCLSAKPTSGSPLC